MSKFDSRIAEYLYSLSLESMQDEEIGDVAELGWYAKFDFSAGAHSVKVADVVAFGLSSGDIAELTTADGFIIREDNDGFVTVESFARSADLESRWAEIEEEDSWFGMGDDPHDARNDV